MEDTLISILETFKVPVMRQGSLPPDEAYPPTFLTFWNTDESEHSPYDNETAITENAFSVYVYSNDPTTTYSLLAQVRAAVKAAGWIIITRGYDVASDEITHTGRGMDINYLDTEKEENNG